VLVLKCRRTLQAAAVAVTSPHVCHAGKKKVAAKNISVSAKKSLSFKDKQLVVHWGDNALRFSAESHSQCEFHVTADEQIAERFKIQRPCVCEVVVWLGDCEFDDVRIR
jgi:hypothetical protein